VYRNVGAGQQLLVEKGVLPDTEIVARVAAP